MIYCQATSARDNDEGRKYHQWSIRCSALSIAFIVGLDVLAIILAIALSVGGTAATAAGAGASVAVSS